MSTGSLVPTSPHPSLAAKTGFDCTLPLMATTSWEVSAPSTKVRLRVLLIFKRMIIQNLPPWHGILSCLVCQFLYRLISKYLPDFYDILSKYSWFPQESILIHTTQWFTELFSHPKISLSEYNFHLYTRIIICITMLSLAALAALVIPRRWTPHLDTPWAFLRKKQYLLRGTTSKTKPSIYY